MIENRTEPTDLNSCERSPGARRTSYMDGDKAEQEADHKYAEALM